MCSSHVASQASKQPSRNVHKAFSLLLNAWLCSSVHRASRNVKTSEVLWLWVLNKLCCLFVFFFLHCLKKKKKKGAIAKILLFWLRPSACGLFDSTDRIMHKNSCLYLARHLNEWCDVQARSSLLLICLLYVPQKPLVLLHWSAALEGQWTSRRMTTRRSYATTSTALTAPGCTFSASTSGRAAFWSSSIASAERGAGTKSSVAKTCGQRRDTTSPSASAPVGAGRVIWRKTLTGTRWNECRMTRRKSLCWRRAREGPWRSQQKRPKRAGQPTSHRKA